MRFVRLGVGSALSALCLVGCASNGDEIMLLSEQVKSLEAQVAILESEVDDLSRDQTRSNDWLARLRASTKQVENRLDSAEKSVDLLSLSVESIKGKTDQFVVRRNGNALNFIVPAGERVSLMKEHRYLIGIQGADAGEYHYQGKIYRSGVRVVEVTDGFPARKAGLRTGDIIYRINDETIHGMSTLIDFLASHGGNELAISFLRDGRIMKLSLQARYTEISP